MQQVKSFGCSICQKEEDVLLVQYWLEILIENQWIPVEMLPTANDIGWTDEAYIINMNDITEWEVNWEWLYADFEMVE